MKPKEITKPKSQSKCPNCSKPFDGIECNNCGFDAYAHDSNWD